MWMASKFPESDPKPNVQLARMRKNDLSISLMPRMNEWGTYMSILFISKNLEKGYKILCVPLEADKTGWKTFKDICIDLCRDPKRVDISLEPMGGVNQVLIKKGFEEEVGALKERCIIINAEQGIDWKLIPEDLNENFHLSRVPIISQVGVNTFKLEMGQRRDVSTLMKVPKMSLANKQVSFSMWSPEACTLGKTWLQKIDRWVDFEGFPVHLRVSVVLKELCKSFGKVSEVNVSDTEGLSTVMALVKECDLTLMPHVIVINDKNVAFPVRLMVHTRKEISAGAGREEDPLNRYVPDPNPDLGNWPSLPSIGQQDNRQPSYRDTLIQIPNYGHLSHPDIQRPSPDFVHPIIQSIIVGPNPAASSHLRIPSTPGVFNSLDPPLFPLPITQPSSILMAPILLTLSFHPPHASLDQFVPPSSSRPSYVNPLLSNSKSVSSHSDESHVEGIGIGCVVEFSSPSGDSSILPSALNQPSLTPLSADNQSPQTPKFYPFLGPLKPNFQRLDHVGIPNTFADDVVSVARDEDDELLSDSGDESSHCAENLEDREEIVQSEEVASFISKKLVEVKEILNLPDTNSKTSEPLFTKKERKIGLRSQRRKKRASLLRRAEKKNQD